MKTASDLVVTDIFWKARSFKISTEFKICLLNLNFEPLIGKKYSTQYVADTKGYRIVNTDQLITVYPKSGGEK